MKLIVEIDGRRQEFALRNGANMIGRDPACDIVIAHSSVSRHHTECVLSGQGIVLRDLASKNGTFIGEQRIKEAEAKPGDVLRIGHVSARVAMGVPPGAAVAATGVPEMVKEIAAPKLPSYTEDANPTPVDEMFAPAGTAAAGDGAKDETAQVAEDEGQSSEGGVAGGGKGGSRKRPLTRRERILFLVPAALIGVLLIVIVVVMVTRKKPEGLIPHRVFNDVVNKAVALYQQGDADAALAQLNVVSGRTVENDPQTAKFLAKAITDQQALTTPDAFNQGWVQTRRDWEELAAYSGSTQEARSLAQKQVDWIRRESRNMASYNEFIAAADKLSFKDAIAAAGKIPNTSLYYSLVEKRAKELAAKYMEDSLAKTTAAEARKDWDAALKIYSELASIPTLDASAYAEKRKQCESNKAQADHVLEADKLISEGKSAEAQTHIAAIDPQGIYAPELAKLQAALATAEERGKALSLYNRGDGDAALKVLDDAKLSDTDLYQRIKIVRDSWEKAEAAMKKGQFKEAINICDTILGVEQNPNCKYRVDATELKVSAPATAEKLARQTRDDGIKAIEKGQFKKARDLFEDAVQIDPKGQIGRQEIDNLRRDAGRQYNVAINLTTQDSARALKMFQDVKDMLRVGDPHYDQVSDWIERLNKKP
jgi:tetratricopeptide (TPR) repeat protein